MLWFGARVGDRAKVKDCFARLTQFVALLNLDEPEDVSEYWGTAVSGTAWQLTADEVRKVLALRDDFKRDDIDKLTLK